CFYEGGAAWYFDVW
nr:immunoglobulin heavy chain junction region [Mus musculus]